MILLDTNVYLNYFRKTQKERSLLIRIAERYSSLAISAVTHYELYIGAKGEQKVFWNEFLKEVTVVPFGKDEASEAVEIFHALQKKRIIISIDDCFIAATAVVNQLELVTFNLGHFVNVDGLKLNHEFDELIALEKDLSGRRK